MDLRNFDPLDPDRHLKRLEKVIGISNLVSNRIKKLTRKSLKIETKEEDTIEKRLKTASDQRAIRNLSIGLNERYLIEIASLCFGVEQEIFFDCAVDSSANIKTINDFFKRNGSFTILLQFQLDASPSFESGRFNPDLKNEKMLMALFSNGQGKKIIGASLVGYRLQNVKAIESENVAEETYFTMLPSDNNIISSIFKSLSETICPALEASKEFGNCSIDEKLDFVFKVHYFIRFLKTVNDTIAYKINFTVNHELFKGFLLAPHQIEATSKRRDKVAEVEKAFNLWIKQIKIVVAQGHQIVRDGSDVGPLTELEHWKKMLSKFKNVVEFSNSRPFQNYLKCLNLSRSKLVKQWKETERNLSILLEEARDNVRYMISIEKFWDPLYRFGPPEITDNIQNLIQAIRNVYITSRFYNTTFRITGLLSKVVNQMIIASKRYLTRNNKISVWDENIMNLEKKLHNCKAMRLSFETNYLKIIDEMKEAGETPFECSKNLLFGPMQTFENRLIKIREIVEICSRYRVLDRANFLIMEPFSKRIKSAFKEVSGMNYDPLDHHFQEFDDDYEKFQKEINNIELEMEQFVKNYVDKIKTVDMRLITLKRFEHLHLECLRLDHRYLDFAELLEKEIEKVKDKYNEERANPSIEWNVPPVIGRIMWSRSLRKMIEEPFNVLKARECVIKHPRAQLCVKYYNFLLEILFHYEAMHHKSWFTYASQVRSKLEVPLIRKNTETSHYELNLDRQILQVIKETESMLKLGLEVPESMMILSYFKIRIFNAYETTKVLVGRNNNLRRSIYPMFVPLMRVQLIKLERIFSPALSTVTWLTQNLDEYFQQIADVLLEIESFLKEVSDINDAQLDVSFKSIENTVLIYLPENAVTPQDLMEMNTTHRQNMEKKIEMKSLAAEKAAIDLINRFVEKSGVPVYDESGKFQLPPEQINKENWRVEETKPINKFDWLSFEKLYKAVGYAAPEENEQLCFREYDGLMYDVNLLHVDCVELFAYYNHKVIDALVKSTTRSMALLKKRSNISTEVLSIVCGSLGENALMKASIELQIPKFVLVPSVQEIQKIYVAIIQNIVETHYGVSTWGKQAKIEERKTRRPLLDEVRHETTWFKMISEHAQVTQNRIAFEDGVMQLNSKVDSILRDFYTEYSYLWDEERETELEKFVQGKPLTADIRDKLLYYDEVSETIGQLDKVICVRTIEIDCEKAIDALIEESKTCKSILGAKLNLFYRAILDEIVAFFKTQQRVLSRDLEELEDCQKLMNSIKLVQENIIRIDQNVNLLDESYALLAKFRIVVPPEVIERAEGLRSQFNAILDRTDLAFKEVEKVQHSLEQEQE